jgi:hypothetical protein
MLKVNVEKSDVIADDDRFDACVSFPSCWNPKELNRKICLEQTRGGRVSQFII